MDRSIIDYSNLPVPKRPRRWWLPLALIGVATFGWWFPRLTPTFYPDTPALLTIGVILIGAFAIGSHTSLPGWVQSAFGALAAAILVLGNLQDNNFRSNTNASELILPWSLCVVGGAIVSRLLGFLGCRAAKHPLG